MWSSPEDDSPQGRLTEGIHALMAEFYSANLAAEIRKGMTQKAKQGGWPHQAPLGYRNIREPIGGRLVACIVPDPDRAHHILAAFELYATGDWTLERLTAEPAARGLCNRGRRDYPPKPLSLGGVAKLLANKAYVGLIDWNGILVQASTSRWSAPELFQRVQDRSPPARPAAPVNASTTTTSKACCTARSAAAAIRSWSPPARAAAATPISTAWAPDPPARAAAANPTSPPTGWNARSSSRTSGSNSPTLG